jgi:aspergillopepsin I
MVAFSKATLAIAGFSAAAMAAPHSKPRLGFSLQQESVPAKSINLPGIYAFALGKFGSAIPPHVQSAAESGQVVTNPTADDEEYVTKVSVGQSTLNLDFDTGSSDL